MNYQSLSLPLISKQTFLAIKKPSRVKKKTFLQLIADVSTRILCCVWACVCALHCVAAVLFSSALVFLLYFSPVSAVLRQGKGNTCLEASFFSWQIGWVNSIAQLLPQLGAVPLRFNSRPLPFLSFLLPFLSFFLSL